jgi:hypothetical protein
MVRPLRSLNGPDNYEKHYSADCGDHNAADKASIGTETKEAEQKATNECTDDADYEIADKAKAAALNQDASQPTGYEPND